MYVNRVFFPHGVQYAAILDQDNLIYETRINNTLLKFINPKNDRKQGFYLLKIAHDAGTSSSWDVDSIIRYVNGGKNCQLTEQKLVRFFIDYNVYLNVICISNINDSIKTRILYLSDVVHPWIILYKSGVQWKLAVHIEENRKFYPLFTTTFIKKIYTGSIQTVSNPLDDTCVSLTEGKHKSSTSSQRRRVLVAELEEKSKARYPKTIQDDEEFARRIQDVYLEHEFGGAESELNEAKEKFYRPKAQPRTIKDQLLTLQKIRPARRRVSKQLSSLKRKRNVANAAFEDRVYQVVQKEFLPKSKPRRQSPVLSDQELARQYAENLKAGKGTPTRLKIIEKKNKEK